MHLYMRVCPSVHHAYFLNAQKRVFSTIEAARDCACQREVIGSDDGGREGGDKGGGKRDGASEQIPGRQMRPLRYLALVETVHVSKPPWDINSLLSAISHFHLNLRMGAIYSGGLFTSE